MRHLVHPAVRFLASAVLATTPPQLTDVQATSLLVAFWRCEETYSSSLIQDPPARALLEALLSAEQRAAYEASALKEIGIDTLAVRTRFIDDWLFDDTFSAPAVVNLGAGMDTRPYRLDCHNKTVYEVDSDVSLLQIKHTVLENTGFQPNCPVVPVGVDVTNHRATVAALQRAGFDASLPTDWIAEGLLEYLEPSSHQSLLKMACECSGPCSRLVTQVLEPEWGESIESLGVSNLPWKDLVSADKVVAQAKEVGWTRAQVFRDQDFVQMYSRQVILPGFSLVILEK